MAQANKLMEQQTMQYNQQQTMSNLVAEKHSGCMKDINAIILKEDNSLSEIPMLFNDVLVIDLDCVEKQTAKIESRNQHKTMDITFAINQLDKPPLTTMLLVELRLNFKNPSNIKRQELTDKINHSKQLLDNCLVPICEDFIFIFPPNIKQQAIRHFYRYKPKFPNNYKVMTIEELKETYFGACG